MRSLGMGQYVISDDSVFLGAGSPPTADPERDIRPLALIYMLGNDIFPGGIVFPQQRQVSWDELRPGRLQDRMRPRTIPGVVVGTNTIAGGIFLRIHRSACTDAYRKNHEDCAFDRFHETPATRMSPNRSLCNIALYSLRHLL
jgi:hypothetical protein